MGEKVQSWQNYNLFSLQRKSFILIIEVTDKFVEMNHRKVRVGLTNSSHTQIHNFVCVIVHEFVCVRLSCYCQTEIDTASCFLQTIVEAS